MTISIVHAEAVSKAGIPASWSPTVGASCDAIIVCAHSNDAAASFGTPTIDGTTATPIGSRIVGLETCIEFWYVVKDITDTTPLISFPNASNESIWISVVALNASAGTITLVTPTGYDSDTIDPATPSLSITIPRNQSGDFKMTGFGSGDRTLGDLTISWTGHTEISAGYDAGAMVYRSAYLVTGATDYDPTGTNADSKESMTLMGVSFEEVSSAGPVYGIATSNSAAATAGKGKKTTQGSATSNASASTVGVGSKTTYGTATANASATTVGVGSKLLMGSATANTSASTVGAGRTSLTGTATSTASNTTVATSNATRPGTATANASASTVAKGGNIVPGTATANASASTDGTSSVSRPGTATANTSAATVASSNATRTGTATLTCGGTTIIIAKASRPGTATSNASASTVGVGRKNAQGTATANASATVEATGGTSSTSSATLTCGATTIAIAKASRPGTATGNASAATNGVGKRILKESATANAFASTNGVGSKATYGSATANASASTEATGDSIAGNTATLTCGATTVAIGTKVSEGSATANMSALVSADGTIYIIGKATANAGANTSAIGVVLGLEPGLVSGCLVAMITNGIFICDGQLPYVPPVPVPGDVLEYSPATLLRDYTINIITLLQSPSGVAVWPAYLGSLPDGDEVPDDSAAFYDTFGWKDGRVSAGDTIEHYGVQAKVRSKEYEDGWAKIEQLAAAYDGINHYYPLTISGVEFILYNVSRNGTTMTLGVEPGTKRRWAFTANFLVSVKQVA